MYICTYIITIIYPHIRYIIYKELNISWRCRKAFCQAPVPPPAPSWPAGAPRWPNGTWPARRAEATKPTGRCFELVVFVVFFVKTCLTWHFVKKTGVVKQKSTGVSEFQQNNWKIRSCCCCFLWPVICSWCPAIDSEKAICRIKKGIRLTGGKRFIPEAWHVVLADFWVWNALPGLGHCFQGTGFPGFW